MERAERLVALAGCQIAAGLAPGDRELLLDQTRPTTAAAGAVLTREGEPGNELFLVLRGEVELWRSDLRLRSVGAGGHFGALSFVTGRPRAASATAAGPVELLVLGQEGWERLAARRPGAALALLQALVRHLREDLVERTDALSLVLRGRTLPRAREVEVTVAGVRRLVATGTPMRQLLPAEVDGKLVVAGLLGQKPVSLTTPICAPTAVAPLTAADWEGRHVYTRSAALLLLEAAHAAAPGREVRIGRSLGPTQLVEVPGARPGELPALAAAIGAEIERLRRADLPFRHELWGTDEAIAWFQERGWPDAARLLRSRREGTAQLVTCGQLYALGMGPILPSTGLVRGLTLSADGGALHLRYGPHDPRHAEAAALPPPGPPSGGHMVEDHRAWLDGMGVRSVGDFNDLCVSGQVSQLIRVAEGFHEKRIGRIADEISARGREVRIICVAGPSSSGKTTFLSRLRVQLQINGVRPVGISLDDYYLDRTATPRDARGDYDFEALEALDLPLLHDHLRRLLAGEPVRTARYDFLTGRSHAEGGPLLALAPGDVLVLEGIHGLNPALLGGTAGPEELFRVFIHPATTLPFDRLTRVSPTDLRLLRRIVRDRHSRGYSAADNIGRWPSVQEGERRHIFPFRRLADAVFDSSLVYELAVLKVYGERYLLEVPPDHPAFGTAWRLRSLVDRFVAIYPEHVPQTSLLREFIGGSGFDGTH
ncbi:MAG: cyclic nucleotide-binding domain-containing protein [Deltaproteobacteria bacterium]|nr:cyclic nucleotide-binding domain-containing protein [Deltaproteobacteria bacterium]